jgi:hypothetical protein
MTSIVFGRSTPGVRPARPAGHDVAKLDRELFRLFIGRNVAGFEPVLDRMEAKRPDLKQMVITWSWPGALVSFPWLLYRKQWAIAALVLLLPVLMGMLLPGNAGGAIWVIVGMMGRGLVVGDAGRRIRKLERLHSDRAELEAAVAKAGGVSVVAASVGGVLYALGLAAALVTTFGSA